MQTEPNKALTRKVSIESAIEDLKTFCLALQAVEHPQIIDFVSSYFDIIRKEEHKIFVAETMKFLETEISSKMPFPTDIAKIENELNSIVRLHGKMNITKEDGVVVFRPVLKKRIFERPLPNLKAEDISAINIEGPESTTDRSAYIENTIDEYLEIFKGKGIGKNDYLSLVAVIKMFFEDKMPKIENPFFVANGNKIRLASQLGIIYKKLKNDPISYEYLDFCRRSFSCFKGEEIDRNRINTSSLYKNITRKKQ